MPKRRPSKNWPFWLYLSGFGYSLAFLPVLAIVAALLGIARMNFPIDLLLIAPWCLLGIFCVWIAGRHGDRGL
jgi:hypothetical protein